MTTKTVPKILYQTWKTKTLPDKFAVNTSRWIEQLRIDGGWRYVLLDDEDLRDLVASNFPQYLDAYDSFTENIERVDFARCVMMYLGGVYADLDTYPTRSMVYWLNFGKIVLGREPLEHALDLYGGREIVLCNALMVSPPGQKLWVELMDYIVQNYEPNYRPVYNTGPMAMTMFMEKYPEKFKDVIITDPCTFFPMLGDGTFSKRCAKEDIYVVHEWDNTWVVPWYRDPRIFNRRYWLVFASIFLIGGLLVVKLKR